MFRASLGFAAHWRTAHTDNFGDDSCIRCWLEKDSLESFVKSVIIIEKKRAYGHAIVLLSFGEECALQIV